MSNRESSFKPDNLSPENRKMFDRSLAAIKKVRNIIDQIPFPLSVNNSNLGDYLKTNPTEPPAIDTVIKTWEDVVLEKGLEFSVSVQFSPHVDAEYDMKILFCFTIGVPQDDPDIGFYVTYDCEEDKWKVMGTPSVHTNYKQEALVFQRVVHSLPEIESFMLDCQVDFAEKPFVSEEKALEVIQKSCQLVERKFLHNIN